VVVVESCSFKLVSLLGACPGALIVYAFTPAVATLKLSSGAGRAEAVGCRFPIIQSLAALPATFFVPASRQQGFSSVRSSDCLPDCCA